MFAEEHEVKIDKNYYFNKRVGVPTIKVYLTQL